MRELKPATKICKQCRKPCTLDQFASTSVFHPYPTSRCKRCRDTKNRRRKPPRRHPGYGTGTTTICGVPNCNEPVATGSPLCARCGFLPPADRQHPRRWYALSCMMCGKLEHYPLTAAMRAIAIVPPCPRCGGFRELTEDRQTVGGPNGSRITTSWRDVA